ncbi:hypothetical protein acsn021_13960 [Anaerocolumna cellulosilytica]|uniref:Uncharacterized protein n=1 Tax=Anaerocolumna cellulosilytica TaxID=433286 RepID=A0A6S6R186_9FIRM|nr:hypothetical protein [Anaerocolumna cellulosilytica]MBB5195584.1 hypothetical protein [Anaerocolumna cellulosilytica]BCJ93827.1 hypothetical protein acsn021_13960 [Anaerocolumna cellulosilytica]
MKKKNIFLRILAAATGLMIIFLLLMILNSMVGNPISAYIATNKIRTYITEAYPAENLIIDKASYNFKDNSYGCVVHSSTSEDTIFFVSVRYGKINDDYPYEVANKYTTLRRLEDALDKEVEAIIKDGFPYQMRLFGAKIIEDDVQNLTLDMPYNIKELPGSIEVIVWTCAEKPSYDIMAQRMLELKNLMEHYDIPVERYSLSLEYPYHEEDGQLIPDMFDSLTVNEFPAEQLIDSSDLPRLLEEYAVKKETEGEKVKEAEIKDTNEKSLE